MYLSRASGNGLPVRTASVLVGVAEAALVIGTLGRGELVWAAAVLLGLAATPCKVRTPGGSNVIWAAGKLRELTTAALLIGTL